MSKLQTRTKAMMMGIIVLIVAIIGIIVFNIITENIKAGYVGYKYDRTIKNGDERTILGTSVINEPLTGLVFINPFTQELLKYPTTFVAKNWTQLEEGDNDVDMSMQVGSKEGKNIIADIYITVKPSDLGKIISSFGLKKFDAIVDDDIYGLLKGKLNIVTQAYSVYDIQSSRSKIQEETEQLLKEILTETYGIELKRLEIGTLILPQDIQTKIDQKTDAMNAVELAKLERQKQDEVNQKIVDEQKATSEKELLRRQKESDALAYEKEKEANANLAVSEANVKIAEQKVIESKLLREAELEKQKSYTQQYFRNRELDNEAKAVESINKSVQTIITDGSGSGFSSLFGIKEILDRLK